ncbi:MAG: CBS domain-containing protein [Deltaproteobacteria bacterium]|nr:CBS domain-containing protein [Deltaproteobacteria bacterium]
MKKRATTRPAKRSKLTIGDVMTPRPITLGTKVSLLTAHRTMNESRLRHVPVVERGKLVGVITQRDLYFLESIEGVDMEKDCVEDAMSADTYTVSPSAPLARVVGTMARKRYGCAVVMEKGKVTGIFTTTDALKMLAGLARAS